MATQPVPAIRKFNPGLFQSDQEVRKQFVVRNHELGLLLDDLRNNISSPSCQHILVVGPRGRGKTMLLARVAAELRSNGEFAGSLLPVRFMEESQEILSFTDFWLETLFHLANEVDEHDAAMAQRLRDTHAALSSRWREQITAGQARAAVLDAADQLGKQLVLFVENLQSLLRDAHDDFGWQLREVLQTEPQIILLASATSRFRELDDVTEPFFEMFRIVGLGPLNAEECVRLWEVVSGRRAIGSEVRPLQILTGGNPRLLVMAAEIARHRSPRRLMSELVTMIDEHTDYFRGHLEALPKTERRVYVAVIDLWQPSSASEIAARARVDIRVVSTMLGRLVERGAVVRQGWGRKRLYAAAEPLYSMYYKLRRERDDAAVVENLIRFMVACYGVGDLWKFSVWLTGVAAESEALRRGIRQALLSRPPLGDCLVDRKWDAIQRASEHARTRVEAKAIEDLEEAVAAAVEAEECLAQAESGLADEALVSCKRLEETVRTWPGNREDLSAGPWVEWLAWRAESARSLALAVQKNHRAALDSFQAAYAVFFPDDEVTMREMLDLVANLVARGAAPRDLLAVLSADTAKSASLRPLIVALHQRAGDRVRAPREVQEVAVDIRGRFREAEERMGVVR